MKVLAPFTPWPLAQIISMRKFWGVKGLGSIGPLKNKRVRLFGL